MSGPVQTTPLDGQESTLLDVVYQWLGAGTLGANTRTRVHGLQPPTPHITHPAKRGLVLLESFGNQGSVASNTCSLIDVLLHNTFLYYKKATLGMSQSLSFQYGGFAREIK